MLGGGTIAHDGQLFTDPVEATPGYESDRTVTDVSDAAMSDALELCTKETTETAGNQGADDGTEEASVASTGSPQTARHTIIVGGFSLSDDETSVNEGGNGEQSGDESTRR